MRTPQLRKWIAAALSMALGLSVQSLHAEDAPTLRIGWQPTSTVEAQIAHTLQKTDILERNGVKAQFTMFSYGPAVNEALVSGAIDIGFIGDLPSVSLAAVGSPTTVVARESTFRGAIIARPGSGIETLADLKGKKLYGPVGSAIYLSAMGMLAKAGLTPGTDVTVVNMGFTDLSDALKAGRVDAVFVWDPWVENFVQAKLAKVIEADTSLTMVTAVRDDLKAKAPDTLKRFLKAQKEALLYAALHPDVANTWFREPAAAKALSPDVVATATAFDPLWSSKSLGDLRLAMTPAEMTRYVGLGTQAASLKIYPNVPPLDQKTDMTIAAQLDKEMWPFDPSSVKVK
jgi:sulfonate transport system substrate-binding protein